MTGLVSKFSKFFSLKEKDIDDDTPLHKAAKAKHYETLREFISMSEERIETSANLANGESMSEQRTANLINLKNGEGETVLHIVMKSADVDIAEFLLEKEADLHIKDNMGNTPLHELVSSADIDAKKCIELIRASRKCNLDELLKVKNRDGQTVLYIASKQGKKDVVEYLLREGAKLSDTDVSGRSALYQLICSIDSPNDKCVELINNLTDQYMEEAMKFERQVYEQSDDPILHVIAANGLTPLVRKLYFLDFHQRDANCDTALHAAVRSRHIDTFREIICVCEEKKEDSNVKRLINQKDAHGETVLHITCKDGDVENILYLIEKGADLEAQDYTGNTPLHDLVDKAANDETIEKYIEVWKALVENVVPWWCSKLQLPQKHKRSFEYITHQRDALYYLRSEIPNNQNLSVIQLAASRGLVKLVREMIWVEGVFVTQSREGRSVKIDVTNLMPHLGGGGDVKYMKPFTSTNRREIRHFACMDEIEQILTYYGWKVDQFYIDTYDDLTVGDVRACCCECYDSYSGFDRDGCFDCGLLMCCFPCIMSYLLFGANLTRKRHSLLDAILIDKDGNKATKIFNIEPINQFVRDYLFAHQWWTLIMITVHLLYMTLYSSYSLKMTSDAFGNRTNMSTLDGLTQNWAYIVWPIMLVIPYFGFLFASPLVCLMVQGKRKLIMEHITKATDIDVKDIFFWLYALPSAIVEFIPTLTPILFCITTICAIEFTHYNDVLFNNLTSFSVILGWVMTFYLASSAFEPVFRFASVFKMILLKDIMPFLFFYIFVLLAYSHGIWIVLSSVPSLAQEYPTLTSVMFELLLVGCGADSRMSSDDIGTEFEKVAIDPLVFKLLFTSYIIVTVVCLLNLIIASMCDSYKKFTETVNPGRRQHSLKMSRNTVASYFIGSKLLQPIFKKLKITERRVWEEKINVEKKQPCTCKYKLCRCVKTGHFFLEMKSPVT